jgi:putative acetyltransferase
VIRAEQPDDVAAIAAVVVAAFGSAAEARLIELIRASEHFVPGWSLVAEESGRVLGHVMVSYVFLDHGDGARRRIPSLSPLAVAPDMQNRGFGGELVREVCTRVDDAGEPFVVLEGSPVYYGRFGFEPAAPLGVLIDLPSWAPPEAAQLLRMRAYDASVRGSIVYPPAFADVIEH